MCAFSAAPTVVTAERDLIHLFVGVLTDVRDPKIACASIEAPAPRVSQAPRVNLRAFAARTSLSRTQRIARERIRRRDPVRRARIDVDAQHLAEHRRETLAVAGVAVLVPTAAAIADADIQIAVGPERDVPTVVVLLGLIDLQQNLLRARVQRRTLIARRECGNARDERIARRVREKDARVLREIRVKGHAEQAHFATGANARAQVEDRRRA